MQQVMITIASKLKGARPPVKIKKVNIVMAIIESLAYSGAGRRRSA
jgi:hypothetical protein